MPGRRAEAAQQRQTEQPKRHQRETPVMLQCRSDRKDTADSKEAREVGTDRREAEIVDRLNAKLGRRRDRAESELHRHEKPEQPRQADHHAQAILNHDCSPETIAPGMSQAARRTYGVGHAGRRLSMSPSGAFTPR